MIDRQQDFSEKRLISVIIPTYKDWDLLKLCLDALEQQTLASLAFEVIVANNDPATPCPFADRLASNVRIVAAARSGSYAARNIAVAVAHGDIFAFTDSDCIPDPGWLNAGIDCLAERGADAWITGPIRMYPPAGGDRLIHLHDQRFAFGIYAGVEKRQGATANMFVMRSTFERVGPFKDEMFSGGDSDWKLRARRLGVSLMVAPDATVSHPSRKTFAELARKERRRAAGSVRLGVSTSNTLARLKPPLGLMRAVDWAGVSLSDRLKVFSIMWSLRTIAVFEFLKVKYAGTQAERR